MYLSYIACIITRPLDIQTISSTSWRLLWQDVNAATLKYHNFNCKTHYGTSTFCNLLRWRLEKLFLNDQKTPYRFYAKWFSQCATPHSTKSIKRIGCIWKWNWYKSGLPGIKPTVRKNASKDDKQPQNFKASTHKTLVKYAAQSDLLQVATSQRKKNLDEDTMIAPFVCNKLIDINNTTLRPACKTLKAPWRSFGTFI